MQIPFEDLGGEGPLIHFAHANGYHPAAYRQLTKELITDHQVIGMHFRPLWKGSRLGSAPGWETHARDLIRFFTGRKQQGVIGVGHSLGAVASLLAAARQPGLFSRLILLDPVILPRKIYRNQAFMPVFLRRRIIPPAKISAKRKDSWPSKQAAFEYLRPKRVFSRISDTVFQDFIDHGIVQEPDGPARLAFSREWETHIYSTSTNPWKAIKKVQCPVMVLRGEQSDVLSTDTMTQLQEAWPEAVLSSVPATGHLLPLEAPKVTAERILAFL